MIRITMSATILCFLLLAGCSREDKLGKHLANTSITEYIAKNKLDFQKTSSGMYYHTIQPGGGNTIKKTDIVTFTYTCKLLDGTPVDIEHAIKPISYPVNKLILGWQEAMQLIKKNGKIQLIVPPQLGYGKQKNGKIPANSILKFELTVVNVE